MKKKYFSILFVVLALSGCKHQAELSLKSPAQFIVVKPLNSPSDKFTIVKQISNYFSATNKDHCDKKSLIKSVVFTNGRAYFKFNKQHDFTLYALANNAYRNDIPLSKINCISTQIQVKAGNKLYQSNVLEYPVVCGGECLNHCACLSKDKIIRQNFILNELK